MSAADVIAAEITAVSIHDPVDPFAFAPWVLIIGIALLVLIAAWYVFVFRYTRERPATTERRGRRDQWASLRSTTLEEVDAAEERYREGETDLRSLHLDLNHILRTFANGRLRMDTSSLTVSELARLEGTDRLTDLLSDYEEPAFAIDSDAEALSATNDARAVISEW
ncbi:MULTISPECIES: hypothetical protein [unclassified Pseudactinotalea]|uniref:hypothetical protein n=1 Tax=unclassified Pseudactinotalea TaxID=2649176 RepID=UPI003C7B90E3